MKEIKVLWRSFKNHKKLFWIDFTCAFVYVVLELVFPLMTQRIIDNVAVSGNRNFLIRVCVFLVIFQILKSICSYIVDYWGHVLGLRIRYDLRNNLFNHLQKLSLSYFDNIKTGELMSRVMGDLENISELAHHGPENLFIIFTSLIGSFVLMMSMNVKLTLIVFSVLPFFIYFAIIQSNRMEKAFNESRVTSADLSSEIEDNLSGIRVIKAFGNEEYISARFEEKNRNVLTSVSGAFKALGTLFAGMDTFSGGVQIIVLLAGGSMVLNGEITVGILIGFLLFTGKFLMPIKMMMMLIEIYQGGMAGFKRYLEVMDIDPDIKIDDDAIHLEEVEGEVSFEGVDFSYGSDENILSNFNLKVETGEGVALVGESGVGKSTICSLIPRFYDVTNGSLKIDGMDIRRLSEESLRKNIAIVQQDVFLFNGTIRENIAFGRLDATEEEIIDASRKANAYDFIMELSDGFDTHVGERGVKLSGGQKQRVSIARVFLKNPKILLLDEATSALDNQTEVLIQESLYELGKGRTTITIAHRLSTVQRSDRIIVMGKNGIEEEGSHRELMEGKGVYASLYNAQSKGFIPDSI